MSPRGRVSYLSEFRGWLRWLGERGFEADPDRLVEIQRREGGYKLLDLAEEYVLGLDHLRAASKMRVLASIRSFFMHNRAELPRDPGFRVRSEVPRVVGNLSVEVFRQILAGCNRLYRAAFLCMFQGGMGSGELVWWSLNGYEELVRRLERREHPIRVDLPGRKRMRNIRPYYTFIGRDAITALQEYLKGEVRAGREAIFINQYGKPLTTKNLTFYWTERLRRLGLAKPQGGVGKGIRYGSNPHELRDLFRTRWEMSGAPGVAAEYFMGHTIDPMQYNKAYRDVDYMMECYLRAEPWLNILSEEPDKVSTFKFEQIRRQQLETERRLREELEQMRKEIEMMKPIYEDHQKMVQEMLKLTGKIKQKK
ncbi:MAG: hypothetical protein QXH67_06220 [Candidatus Bathyarchaeia archaeon]